MKGFFARQPELVLAMVTILWGSTFVVTHDLMERTPPLAYLTLRFGAATLLLLALFPSVWGASRALLGDALRIGFFQATGLLLQVLGQAYTTASKSAFVASLATALTPFLALALYGELPTLGQAVGVLLASLGLTLLTYPAAGATWNRGDLLTVASAVGFTFVIVETARRAPRHRQAQLATLQTATAALVFLLFLVGAHLALAFVPAGVAPASPLRALLELERRPLPHDLRILVEIGYMALFCTVVTFLAQTWAMARMSATRAAIVFALEPVLAMMQALLIYGRAEWPGARGAAGGLLVLVAVFASEIRWTSRGRIGGAD